MTREGWRALVVMAVRNADAGEASSLDLLAQLLEEQDLAKAALSLKGYGCTGMPWLDVVAEVPSAGTLQDDLQCARLRARDFKPNEQRRHSGPWDDRQSTDRGGRISV